MTKVKITSLETVDVPEQEWLQTKYKNLKFSRSKSSRATYLIDMEEKSGTNENSDPREVDISEVNRRLGFVYDQSKKLKFTLDEHCPK